MSDFFDKIAWSPSIGDPSLMGWLTVGAYFLCAYKCLRVYKYGDRIFHAPVLRQSNLWLGIGVFMLCLGINKQLDLQSFFTQFAKYLAHEQGWYQERRIYQKAFIFAIGLGGLFTLVSLLIYYHKVMKRHVLAMLGLCTLLVFVMVRALSFHKMDAFLGSSLAGIKMNWLLELSGIALVFLNARKLIRQMRPLIDLNELQKKRPSIRDEEL